jgi:hypothetical protein
MDSGVADGALSSQCRRPSLDPVVRRDHRDGGEQFAHGPLRRTLHAVDQSSR